MTFIQIFQTGVLGMCVGFLALDKKGREVYPISKLFAKEYFYE